MYFPCGTYSKPNHLSMIPESHQIIHVAVTKCRYPCENPFWAAKQLRFGNGEYLHLLHGDACGQIECDRVVGRGSERRRRQRRGQRQGFGASTSQRTAHVGMRSRVRNSIILHIKCLNNQPSKHAPSTAPQLYTHTHFLVHTRRPQDPSTSSSTLSSPLS